MESMIFERLQIWRDTVARSGTENMAVDECLLRDIGEVPVLRFYDWRGDWVSLGYFQSLADARGTFGGDLEYVRRWSGGGIVDHRSDSTYTLVIPRSEKLAGSRGSESYCAIHRAVAECLRNAGTPCELTSQDSQNESTACFEKPVLWDIVGSDGRKLAGAGQRRGRSGVLHQGSVAASMEALGGLGANLAKECVEVEFREFAGLEDVTDRYARKVWLERVP